jgi:redox-sensitive bicupin YhaK (pirin superfamily)
MPGMSGPATTEHERYDAREVDLGGLAVRRLLPRRGRRTVGAWCFLDHFGPADADMRIGPHPHIGLQTVTWLLDGEVVHHDSLGSEQPIRPGQLNLMTAGRGVAHAEESPERASQRLHGAQLWVAQPSSTRHGDAAFEHHAELPRVELGCGTATVLLGELAGSGTPSPARTDTPIVGLAVRASAAGDASLPLDPGFEHAVVVLGGAVTLAGQALAPGTLVYVPPGAGELALAAVEPSDVLVLGGAPFGEELAMWWNFVGRTRDELAEARDDWESGTDRFGPVASAMSRIGAPAM